MERSENQQIHFPVLTEKKISLYLKREDLLHPFISGNKYRKLKYNLIQAKAQGCHTLMTFGGAYSNHIAATAYAGKLYGLKTVGMIRGEELVEKWQKNPTLSLAHKHGMRFDFVDRETYRSRENTSFLKELEKKFGKFYLVPEGGTNPMAVHGCEEILTAEDFGFDVVCCPVGTGGTLAGLTNSASKKQEVLGFTVLKGDFLKEDIRKFVAKENWSLQTDYHFGGYAKVSEELIGFINDFKRSTQIPLDPVYTGKMMFGLFDMIKRDRFKTNTRILAIHTGGLQGISGMNTVLKRKNLPLIAV